MNRSVRKIIRIDEEKCDGCGICADACHEGAIQIIGGKAKLVKESYCDGLGDCIGPCPQDAISFEERVAEEYDEEAVKTHLEEMARSSSGCSCPSAAPVTLQGTASEAPEAEGEGSISHLSTWPVQITLVPPSAPFLRGAHLLVTADCVPFALPDFHINFLRNRVALVGCPKLDDAQRYVDKFTEIFRISEPASVTVLYMEVPCCGGMPRIVQAALGAAGRKLPVELVKVSIRGEILERETVS